MPESTRKMRRTGNALTAEMLTQASATLKEIDWRLLHWLLRYPLQRVDDLVVGVARWASRATVYRHFQGLEASGFVESVLPKTMGTGKRLYHLSNLGLQVQARHLERPAGELAHEWQAGETGLLRRLPRLPTLLLLQDVVNSLVTGAAEAMTTQGRRPQLVRWTWQRDIVHRFNYREQAARMFVDGAVALCIRAPQRDGTTLDQWYGLFLLFTELDNERVMRLRLERLLCWREAPERWPVYQHMPPVLILAASPRQCDHWQRAVADSALKLRLEPPSGAMACLPRLESTGVDPWRLAWHEFSTGLPCRLQELLRPVPPESFLPALEVGQREEGYDRRSPSNVSGASGPSERPARLVIGNLASRVRNFMRDDLEEREVIAFLGMCLNPRHWSMLRLLLAHPLLSDEELARLLNLQRRSVRSVLYTLHALGCLGPIATEAGRRWHLCERGLRLMATASHIHIRNMAVESDDETENETARMSQRGETWLLQHIQHTAGVYGFFATLVQAARQQPEQELCWWETGAVCERRYSLREQWHNLRPDALAGYRIGQKQFRFWLEWDRGTMNARDLATKFSSYKQYIDSHEWAKEWSSLPLLFCVTPDIAQERRIQRVAQVKLAHIPGKMMWTTTEILLNEHGPLASIWLPSILPPRQVAQPSRSLRQRMFDMVPEKNATRGVVVSRGGGGRQVTSFKVS